ncbi:hypothetical protein O6H91_09G005300 [Diphasiastrum complanatum]|uniref:Uncharacterized protein n=1 Tax=Diphasiastrum complanatum TaxID=34168 RepID=A0ACC2CL22_DIPCM|nr:hypothetical protein O6H91_09G005300 [Diphasiastrum complanatum]
MMLLNGARGETSFQAGATMKKFNLVTSTNEDVILHDDLGSANCTISREDSCTQTSQSLAFKPNDLKRCLEASVDSNSFAQNFNFTAEEPARMKGNYEVDLENLKQDTMIKQQSFAMAFEAPAHLSEAQVKELGPVLLVIDQYHMECLLSRQWLLRDKALHFLESNLQSKDVDDDLTSTFRAAHKILIQALNDKVSTVFHTSLQVLRVCMEKYAAHVPSKEIHSSACEMVSILLEKLGDSNVRTKEAAAETILFLASKKEIGLQVISPLILKSPKNQAIWKPVLGRLQFLLMAVPNFKLQPQNQLGFSLDSLMAFVVLCFSSPSGEVRNAAMKVTNEVYKLLGPPVEKYLKGVKPVIYEALVNSFEKAGSAAPKDRASSSIDKSSQDSECQKCLQAVPESKMGTHTKSKECRLVKGQKMNHCPLCRNSVQPGDLGWRAHLLGPPGCAKNSRTKP